MTVSQIHEEEAQATFRRQDLWMGPVYGWGSWGNGKTASVSASVGSRIAILLRMVSFYTITSRRGSTWYLAGLVAYLQQETVRLQSFFRVERLCHSMSRRNRSYVTYQIWRNHSSYRG